MLGTVLSPSCEPSEKWNISCHISKHGYHSHHQLQPSNVSWALRELGKEKNTCHLAAIKMQPLSAVSPKEVQEVKNRQYWPQIAEVHIKGMVSVQTLASSHTQKGLNSLSRYIWFSFISNNILTFRPPALYCETLHKPGFSSHLLRVALSRSLHTLSPKLEVLKILTE